jgi:hypothetical protein
MWILQFFHALLINRYRNSKLVLEVQFEVAWLACWWIGTLQQCMRKIWHAFENYDYEDLYADISQLRKNKDESFEYFLTIFMLL